MIFVGVGSNLGDRWAALAQAWEALEARAVRVVASSPVYETAPWGEPDQPYYLNAVWAVETELSPEALLAELQRVEAALGRPTQLRSRWAARTLDLDLLAYHAEERRTPTLPCRILGYPIGLSCWGHGMTLRRTFTCQHGKLPYTSYGSAAAACPLGARV